MIRLFKYAFYTISYGCINWKLFRFLKMGYSAFQYSMVLCCVSMLWLLISIINVFVIIGLIDFIWTDYSVWLFVLFLISSFVTCFFIDLENMYTDIHSQLNKMNKKKKNVIQCCSIIFLILCFIVMLLTDDIVFNQ